MIFFPLSHGPSGLSASAYHTSPSIVSPISWLAIITYFLRYAFQLTEQLLMSTGLPESTSRMRCGESSDLNLPVSKSAFWSFGFSGGVFFFHAQRSSCTSSLPVKREPAFKGVNASYVVRSRYDF